MSINWVMLSPSEGFVRLPNERILFTSPPRTSLTIQSPTSYPGRDPFSLSSSTGVAYVTSSRIVYLPSHPTPQLSSFSVPVLKVHDSHISTPFFGPNGWTAAIQPVAGGGLPPAHPAFEIKMTFKDGGAFDFHSSFEKIKELQHNARANGQADPAAVTLEQLPTYEDSHSAPLVDPETPVSPVQMSPLTATAGTGERRASGQREEVAQVPERDTPSEPPPGYEEVQRESVATELERRLRPAS